MGSVEYFDLPVGDSRNVEIDFTIAAANFGLNFASVTWAIEAGDSVTINGVPTISSNISTGLLVADATKTGCTIIKVQGTLSDNQTVSEFFRVNVFDPVC